MKGRLRHAITDNEKISIEDLVGEVAELDGETTLQLKEQECMHSTFLIDGYIMRAIRHENNASLNIVGYQVAGDFVDLQCFALRRLDHDLITFGKTKVGFVPHKKLRTILEREPHLARILWFSSLLDTAIHRERIMKIQQLQAVGRLSHLFAELWYRLRMVGLVTNNSFQTPFTQGRLGELCGLSTIHISRSLRDLRERGIVEFHRGRITILNADALKVVGRFDPSYLYGEGDLAMGSEINDPFR